jgi:hypothetical protein
LISDDTETQYQTLQSIALPTELHSVLILQPHRFRTKRCTRTHTHNHAPYIALPHTPRSPLSHGPRSARQNVSNLSPRLQRTNVTTRLSTSCPRGGAVAQTPTTSQLRPSLANDPARHRPGRNARENVRGNSDPNNLPVLTGASVSPLWRTMRPSVMPSGPMHLPNERPAG